MRILTTARESSLRDLAHSLFEIKGPTAAADEKRAIDALRAANPQLSARAKIPARTPLTVPDVEKLKPGAEAPESADLRDDLIKQLKEAISSVGQVLEAEHDQAQEEDNAEMRQLKEHTKELTAADKSVGDRLKQIQEGAAQRKHRRTEQREIEKRGLAQLRKDLDTLLQRPKR
jgi:hypothetical protein